MIPKNETELLDAAGILYLTANNCKFEKAGDFLAATVISDDEKHYNRVNLHRLFPFDRTWSHISVLNTDSEEVGIIANIDDFDNDTAKLLKAELNRKYYVCKLTSILGVRDRFGFSYWRAKTIDGEVSFTIRDAHNSIRQNSDGKILLTDIDNNRYELKPFETLDKKTRKRIELYL